MKWLRSDLWLKNRFGLPLIVWVLFIIGLTVRVWGLGSYPSELHRDEAAIAWNAYSLLKTGYDEHGAGPWPILFESFADYKLPVLVYLDVLTIKLFGLHNWAFR